MAFIKMRKNAAEAGALSARRRLANSAVQPGRHKTIGRTTSINAASPRPAAQYIFAQEGVDRRAGGARPTVRSWARIRKDLRVVKAKLRGLVTAPEMKRWLVAQNNVFGGLSPLEAIYCGDTGRVLAALAQLEEGIFV